MPEDLFSVRGKIIVVTGGLGQLGRQFSLALADRGARVAVFDLKVSEKTVAERFGKRASDGNLRFLEVDITDRSSIEAACAEIIESINQRLAEVGLKPIATELIETKEKHGTRLKDTAEKVVNAYGEALVKLGEKRKDIVVLDADLAADYGLRLFEAVAGDCPAVFVLDNHSPHGGLGDCLLNTLFLSRKVRSKKFYKLAVEGFPACDTPAEALAYHRLDGRSLVERILTTVDG